MPQPGVRCEGHDELVKTAGRNLQAAEEHGKQLSRIFDKLNNIETSVDQNQVRALVRDENIRLVRVAVEIVDAKIENGLRSQVQEIAACIKKMAEATERRRVERDEEAKTGVKGFLTVGWNQFKSQAAMIFVTGTIITLLWLMVFVITKVGLFHEGPMPLLNLFGLGQ